MSLSRIIFIVSLIVALISSGLLGYEAWMLYQSKNDIEILKKNITDTLQKQSYYRATELSLKVLESARDDINKHALSEAETVSFIEDLEKLAREQKVSISIQNANMQSSPKKNLVISLSVQGSWRSVTTYVALLDALPFATQLQNVQLNADGSAQGTQRWRADIRFSVPAEDI